MKLTSFIFSKIVLVLCFSVQAAAHAPSLTFEKKKKKKESRQAPPPPAAEKKKCGCGK